MAKGFALVLRLLALIVDISGTGALSGSTRADVVILIIVIIDDLVI
jgi:hypothetical protein